MPVYRLTEEIAFPPPELTDHPDGLLAVGGDLRPERLLTAYQMGIFPWYSEEYKILWWSPDPRLILEPERFHLSKSLEKVIRKKAFDITVDTAFERVVQNCASVPRKTESGTWITAAMMDAYCDLHVLGFAHSVETWQDGKLAGGLYGVSLGRVFFGESMFSSATNASKVALYYLCVLMKKWNLEFIDCQLPTNHLIRMGAYEISRDEFLRKLHRAVEYPTIRGNWRNLAVL
ncbi:leucyl/phenylalanyl-tRNA--protein transferase [candidate division KSB1 bacterium]|nr:leucyl/phenylalanyl-tRNA--protein transferase [candidate division KSB1 bacterium]